MAAPPAPATAELADWLAESLGPALGQVEVRDLERLSGGASRETWSFDALDAGGSVHQLVLRRDPPGRPSAQGAMGREAAAIKLAFSAGLDVPEVLLWCEEAHLWGTAGIVMRRVEGETIARRILRDEQYAPGRAALAGQCARFLAGLHRFDPGAVPGLTAGDPVTQYRQQLDLLCEGFGQASPAFELTFRWLDEHRPPSRGTSIVHGDFRLGNLIVGPEGLRAVLDWELLHAGDPIEDLGWLCVKAWRFGGSLPVGGFGPREDLLAAYHAAGGPDVDLETLRWWEVLGTLKWGIACVGQAAAHLSGAVRSVELATIGRRVCEQEWDLMILLAPESLKAYLSSRPVDGTGDRNGSQDAGLHGRPTSLELLTAVREFLAGEVQPATSGRLSFHSRVAANALGMVEREMRMGPVQERRRAGELERFGVASDVELAQAIRAGGVSGDDEALIDAVVSGVAARLEVANPRYLEG